jgi:cytochrome c5
VRAAWLLLCGLGCVEPQYGTLPPVRDTGGPCVPDTGGGHPTWASFAGPFFRRQCASCHAATAPERFGAPEGVTFDTEAEVLAQRAAVERVVLTAETMPPGGGVSDAERDGLRAYLECVDAAGTR